MIGCVREQRTKGGRVVYLDTNLLYMFSASGNQTRSHSAPQTGAIEAADALYDTTHERSGKTNKAQVFFIRLVNVCTQGIQEGLTWWGEVCTSD